MSGKINNFLNAKYDVVIVIFEKCNFNFNSRYFGWLCRELSKRYSNKKNIWHTFRVKKNQKKNEIPHRRLDARRKKHICIKLMNCESNKLISWNMNKKKRKYLCFYLWMYTTILKVWSPKYFYMLRSYKFESVSNA